MQKLNLDIFGQDEEEQNKKPRSGAPNATTTRRQTEPVTGEPTKALEAKGRGGLVMQSSAPRFVPVGFYAEHLRMLDEAVLALRHRGHWRASKSAIIRRLLEENADRLTDVFLGKKK